MENINYIQAFLDSLFQIFRNFFIDPLTQPSQNLHKIATLICLMKKIEVQGVSTYLELESRQSDTRIQVIILYACFLSV